jgi:ribosomal protein S18 acetylase RimI-like enzyme
MGNQSASVLDAIATTDLVFREATVEDATEVIRLFGALHAHNASLDACFELAEGWPDLVHTYLEQSLRSEESIWLVAAGQEHLAGFVLVEVHADSPLYRHRHWAEIVGLYVEPEARGSGVARRLMERAYVWAAARGLPRVQLYVSTPNIAAQSFYRREGFEATQFIMRRMLSTDAHAPTDARSDHAPDRLHFSEGGERPLDMHGHRHPHAEPGRHDRS